KQLYCTKKVAVLVNYKNFHQHFSIYALHAYFFK
ncbi:MAG: hypothetical protein ACJA0G_001963, partial [Kangiellaceae bacterium]